MTALVLTPISDAAEEWRRCFAAELPELEIRVWPNIGKAHEIEFAALGPVPKELFAALPKLRLIASLFAGAEMLLRDPALPANIPLMRAGSPSGDAMMNETVLLHVLRHHRYLHEFLLAQQRHEWIERPRLKASVRKVGVMGLGLIGLAAARGLQKAGFDVAGWVRRPRQIDGLTVFHGREALPAFLARSEILVNLLPLTPETRDILNRETLHLLPRGAAVINLGRGQHLVDADLVAALDEGQLAAATLDVFRQEPLPAESPLWAHPRITVIPHAARRLNAADLVPSICENIRRLRRSEPLLGLIDRAAGY